MIVTGTDTIDNYEVETYHGIVASEIVLGSNFIRDILVALTNFFGGRSGQAEYKLDQGRELALEDLKSKAKKLGANAILKTHIHSGGGQMALVSVQGTAVTVKRKE